METMSALDRFAGVRGDTYSDGDDNKARKKCRTSRCTDKSTEGNRPGQPNRREIQQANEACLQR